MAEASATFVLRQENCHLDQFDSWQGRTAAFDADLARTLGIAVPEAVGETRRGPGFTAIRVAPRRIWLLHDEAATPPPAVDPELGCFLMLRDGRVRLRMRGSQLAGVLKKCLPVDWTPLADGSRHAIQTGLHRIPVLLLSTAPFECDLLVPRSFARSVVAFMEDAAAAFGYPPVAS